MVRLLTENHSLRSIPLHPINIIVLEQFEIEIKMVKLQSNYFKWVSFYRAPELDFGEEETEKSQVYGIGCVMLEMLTNKCAWDFTKNMVKGKNPFLKV